MRPASKPAAVVVVVAAAFMAWSTPLQAQARVKDTGKKITIDLQQAELVNVIRLIGDVGNKNIVVGEEVKGKITLKLKNVGWRRALDVVLKSGNFGYVEDGDLIWVTLQSRIDDDELALLDQGAARELKGPLTTRIVPINYARAEEMIALVKPLLTARGSVSADPRTNVLIIRDVRSSAALRQF